MCLFQVIQPGPEGMMSSLPGRWSVPQHPGCSHGTSCSPVEHAQVASLHIRQAESPRRKRQGRGCSLTAPFSGQVFWGEVKELPSPPASPAAPCSLSLPTTCSSPATRPGGPWSPPLPNDHSSPSAPYYRIMTSIFQVEKTEMGNSIPECHQGDCFQC